MTVIAAVTQDREGRLALVEGLSEARRFGDSLVAVNLGTAPVNLDALDTNGVQITVVDHPARDKDSSADVILDEIEQHQATRLVIGVKRRTPVGKALLGSFSQHLLLHAPIPVLAVKLPEDEFPSSSLDHLPPTLRGING